MDEKDFWVRLEFRICAEFQRFEDKHLRWYWCDGLVAEQYDLLGEKPCIRGQARFEDVLIRRIPWPVPEPKIGSGCRSVHDQTGPSTPRPR